MASQFQHDSLKIVIAQICQNIGFQGIYSTPLNVLIDLSHRYLHEIATATHRYCEHNGRTIPNIDDATLAFKEMGISISELEEYISYVEPINFPHEIPKIPVPKPSNLNFLKPGAREILSRPLYVHEHLPPMYPEKEDEDVSFNASGSENLEENSDQVDLSSQAMRISDTEISPNKNKINLEEDGEPVREIDSVMMTTSGFISSAREGKMPESKRPNIPLALPRSSSPVPGKSPALIKKKMEKIMRHKKHQGHGGILPGPLAHNKLKKEFKLKPKIPCAPPGTGSLPRPGGIPPKLKIPVPPVQEKNIDDEDRKRKRDKECKRGDEHRDRKRDKERRRDRNREERRRDKNRSQQRDRPRIRMKGLSREEELRRYKERENELIAALAASSAVTVTSIPPPSLRVREKTPEDELQEKEFQGKMKTIFKKRIKDNKGNEKHRSREASPRLMIDDNIVKEEPKSRPSSPALEFGAFNEEPIINNPVSFPSIPKTPDIPPVKKNKRGRPHKIKTEDGIPIKIPKIKTESSPRGHRPRGRRPKRGRGRGLFSPSWRNSALCESTPELPKTPEGGEFSRDGDNAVTPPFSIPTFPNAPGFIPPFSQFSFSPFGIPPPGIPPVPPQKPDINPIPNLFIGPFGEKNEETRPATPSHDLPTEIVTPLSRNEDDSNRITQPKIRVKDPHLLSSPKHSKSDKEKKKEHKKKEKDKAKKKKEKKERAKEEKKKEKERLKQEKREKKKRGRKRSENKEAIPKIMFRLQTETESNVVSEVSPESKPTPKLVIKQVVKPPSESPNEHQSSESKKRSVSPSPSSHKTSIKLPPEEEPGSPPEIAKISALITRPPKGSQIKKSSSEPLTVPPLKIKDPNFKLHKKESTSSKHSKEHHEITTVPPLKIRNAGGPIEVIHKKTMSSKKLEKKEKKKKKLASLKLGLDNTTIKIPPLPQAASPPRSIATDVSPPHKSSKKSTPVSVSSTTPADQPPPTTGLASSSTSSSGLVTETVGPIGHFVDDQGNEVWICPTCGKQDDGSPMIGCDTCDDWYHWLCVGIHVPPSERENWYCPRCISQHKQKGGAFPEKKKRGRKRKIPIP